MDLLDLLILALRIVLVALLYLFLASVMRMAAGGLRPRRTRGVVEPVPVPVPVLSLVVLESGSSDLVPGQAVELKDAAILGRAERADVVLADPAVSSEHARVSRVGRAWVISDLGSTNGTRLNDRRVDGDVPLAQGDVVALGNVRFRVGTR
ncbi:MAG TPA: FHA domain-containing protein [Chloroflexota bacterium]|nr:FHA domain-containing protein [Chloroflexota bacterium]